MMTFFILSFSPSLSLSLSFSFPVICAHLGSRDRPIALVPETNVLLNVASSERDDD